MSTLGVVIFSANGMKHLAQCLASVAWADSVLVVHVGQGEPSVDSRGAGPAIVHRVHSIGAVREVCSELATDWVLSLSAEERVGESLQKGLRAICARGTERAAKEFRIPVRSRVLGEWALGNLWERSPAIRLGPAIAELTPEWLRERKKPPGAAAPALRGWIEDYTLAELSDGFDQIRNLSSIWADHLHAEGTACNAVAGAVESIGLFLRVLWANGFIAHGFAGLTLATLAAYAALASHARLWEIRNLRDTKPTSS